MNCVEQWGPSWRSPMDRLEQYVDQVCRHIGGPRAMRQHVRQELREHLLDAVAQHRAAGMPEDKAVEQALEEFGQPEELRSEMEAAHGQRVLAVVLDKAMGWKERTMKAKWLWSSWAYLSLVAVIGLEVFFLTFTVIFLIPRFQRLMRDGLIDPAILDDGGAAWMVDFLQTLKHVGGDYATFWLVGSIMASGLFEWLVRSENKPFMRLAALGTVAVALTVVVILTGGSLVVTYQLGAPQTGRMARLFAVEQVQRIDSAVTVLEKAQAKKDWEAMHEPAEQAAKALTDMTKLAPVIPALVVANDMAALEAMRAQVRTASESWAQVQQAIRNRDAARLEAALERFRKAL